MQNNRFVVLTGHLSNYPLSDLVGILRHQRKSGRLLIEYPKGPATFFFHEGELIDARMNEVYWGRFVRGADGLMIAQMEERVSPPETVAVEWKEPWVGAGSGWGTYPAMAGSAPVPPVTLDPALFPRAEEIAHFAARDFKAGLAVSAAQAQPVYLRDKVARAPGAAK